MLTRRVLAHDVMDLTFAVWLGCLFSEVVFCLAGVALARTVSWDLLGLVGLLR